MARNADAPKAKRAKTGPRALKRQISGAASSQSPASVDIAQPDVQRMIAEAAYYRAQQRGFCGGDPVQDWLEAEAEVSVRLGAGVNGHGDLNVARAS